MRNWASGQVPALSQASTAIRDLHPGYFAFVMAPGIISTGTFMLGPSWLSRALLVAALATLFFGKAVHLGFMEAVSRLMLWIAVAAWAMVAAAFLARFTLRPGDPAPRET
jgi:hypothetical protein